MATFIVIWQFLSGHTGYGTFPTAKVNSNWHSVNRRFSETSWVPQTKSIFDFGISTNVRTTKSDSKYIEWTTQRFTLIGSIWKPESERN